MKMTFPLLWSPGHDWSRVKDNNLITILIWSLDNLITEDFNIKDYGEHIFSLLYSIVTEIHVEENKLAKNRTRDGKYTKLKSLFRE